MPLYRVSDIKSFNTRRSLEQTTRVMGPYTGVLGRCDDTAGLWEMNSRARRRASSPAAPAGPRSGSAWMSSCSLSPPRRSCRSPLAPRCPLAAGGGYAATDPRLAWWARRTECRLSPGITAMQCAKMSANGATTKNAVALIHGYKK